MSSSTARQANRWIQWVLRLIGLGIFVLAFFLPAVRAGGPAANATVFSGWKCASVALTETVALFGKSVHWPPPLAVLLVVFSGWINPLAALVLLTSLFAKLRILRRALGVFILLCIAATWYFFALQKVTPLAGHWLWIAGALLILLPEAICGRRSTVPS
ncbi:MAG TPA: hypothetical protein VHX20_14595 [Terracidiphilus sp.]|jgi:hypothetical protein|nr:hypothetical protein [Terracidiphilus sp.]